MEERTGKHIRVFGIVQGVGFRPFVSRIADACQIKGTVANKGSYVEIFTYGTISAQDRFRVRLEMDAPKRSAILAIEEEEIPYKEEPSFEIIESEHEEGDIFVSPDIATCPECKKELFDPKNKRYLHPFINCTACGPRLTILDAMPYDRERTSMKEFPMCPSCEYEYTHAETRRYDAQPVCCNDCGPQVYLIGRPERGADAITFARKEILEGKIVAIKGIGGFHLCCDAQNNEAVKRLRQLKNRPSKPFAVMMKNIDTIRRECVLPENMMEIIDGPQKPILLLERKENGTLGEAVAPDNPKVGVMLPYAPVQMLLFDYTDGLPFDIDVFVMTSGNVSGAPICRTDEDAVAELSHFCDCFLSHDRAIRLRADDSVMNLYHDQPYMIRRSRGYAPLPVMSKEEQKGMVLAVGGELKNSFTLAKDRLYYPSPYVGDMQDVRTVTALKESIERMAELLEITPQLVVSDLHPKYNTVAVAEGMDLPIMKIQHHYAHVLSCMAENQLTGPVIGVSFDGTGYGTDGTIWGGEILLSDTNGFQRSGSIVPFTQIGGDLSAKEGWRIAVSMINDLFGADAPSILKQLSLGDEKTAALYRKMKERKINAVTSTSAGRLFDAVSAILNIRKVSTFEGEASTTCQFRAEHYRKTAGAEGAKKQTEAFLFEHPMAASVRKQDGRILLATDELVRAIVEEKLKHVDDDSNSEQLAYLFHACLAKQITAACVQIQKETDISRICLSGGVFLNTLLLELVENGIERENTENKEHTLEVFRHHLIAPNDQGLSLGQAFYGMHQLKYRK